MRFVSGGADVEVKRPWPSIGIGWLLAVIALLIGVLHLVGVPLGAEAIWWCVILLALALLL